MQESTIQFKHIILTHFNIKLTEDGDRCFSTDKNNQPTIEDSWMEKRFQLFDKYCFPSVQGQTNQNFKWLLFMDSDTLPKYREQIAQYSQQFDKLAIIYIDPVEKDKIHEVVSPILKSYLDEEDEYVITTNLDNDDSIHKDMVDELQRAFLANPEASLYRLVYGYQYFEDLNFLMKMRYPHNHFLTLATKVNPEVDIIPITSYEHGSAHRKLTYRDVKIDPMWIEIVHQSNVNNNLRVKLKIRYTPVIRAINLNKRFHIDVKLRVVNNLFRVFITLPWMVIKHLYKKFVMP